MAALHYILVLLSLFIGDTHAIKYNGTVDSWAQYQKLNLCPHKNAGLSLKFNSDRADGLLAYMDGGATNPSDYLLVELKGGRVSVRYQFGVGTKPDGASFTRENKEIATGTEVEITIERKRMLLELVIDNDPGTQTQVPDFGGDLCFGECLDGLQYTLPRDNSDFYVGGVPQSIRRRIVVSGVASNFEGEIYDVAFRNCECTESNPAVLRMGVSAMADDCTNRTGVCPCRLKDGECDDCGPSNCRTYDVCKGDLIEYALDFEQRENTYLKNGGSLDAETIGEIVIPEFPVKHLQLDSKLYAQLAGESQRDECLGNLALCPRGYTISFWVAVVNENLVIRDGIIIDNGGSTTHGVSVFWQNNALHTKFKKPDGNMWISTTYEFYPARIYYEPRDSFENYWYHYAASWSNREGLYVYMNGVLAGHTPTSTYEQGSVDTGVNRNSGRQAFYLGTGISQQSNDMGIADIKFANVYRTQNQIIGTETGLRHYFLSMNDVVGRRLAAWPPSLYVSVMGDAELVDGKSDMAMKLVSTGSYIDAGDVNSTCFGQIADCSLYISFWVKFDTLLGRMTILDTGNRGITVRYSDGTLEVLLYPTSRATLLTCGGLRFDEWYFVEVNRDSRGRRENQLWVNGELMMSRRGPVPRSRMSAYLHGGGDAHHLLIGRKNSASGTSDQSSGTFTIDQLDLLQGTRDSLRRLGHIQRGIPPHIFYNMNGFWRRNPRYLSYQPDNIEQDPTAEIMGPGDEYQFVPGKDMRALSLSGSTFEITQRRRNEECYNNLEKCIHGLLIRGWFYMEELNDNAGFMSSGFNGINMMYQNERLVVTANTLSKQWRLDIGDVRERKWMFLELSFHPKYGLSVYKNKRRLSTVTQGSNTQLNPPSYTSKFIVGGTNDVSNANAQMIVDDLEIWYGDRDYICSLALNLCEDWGGKHYVIDFDEWDRYDRTKLSHELLVIPAEGTLLPSEFEKAMRVVGRDNDGAEVTTFKTGNRGEVTDACFGNLTLCYAGYTVRFYFNPDVGSLATNRRVYLLSTGTSGIDVYYMNGILHAEARAKIGSQMRQWKVNSTTGYIRENNWNHIIVAWSPVRGLMLAKDEKMYLAGDQAWDMAGQEMENTTSMGNEFSQFLIGNVNTGVREIDWRTGASRSGVLGSYDEMRIEYNWSPGDSLEHESFSFERNHLLRSKVEHPKFNVQLMNGAEIEPGFVGNTSLLNGFNQYVSLGVHTDSWVDNLDLVPSGLTLSFRVKLKGGFNQENQVILSGESYDISVVDDSKLQVKLMSKDKEWVVRSYRIPVDQWVVADVSWTKDGGMDLYVDGSPSGHSNGVLKNRISSGTRLLVGRANNQANRRYFNGEIDEIHFYRRNREQLIKDGIITPSGCDFTAVKIEMDRITNGKVDHPSKTDIIVTNNPRVVSGVTAQSSGIQLEDRQSIDFGNRLSCQSRRNACIRGFTMRFSIKPTAPLVRNSYLVSGNFAEVTYENDDNIHVKYKSVDGVWEAVLTGLDVGTWYTFDISWDDENGMTVYVNGIQRAWTQKTSAGYPNYNRLLNFYANKPSSPLVTDYRMSEFVLDNLEIWDAKYELLRACGFPDPPTGNNHHAIYPSNGAGYIRLFYIPTEYYISDEQNENLTIRFSTDNGDGLLWYNIYDGIKYFVYLKNGELWFHMQNGTDTVFDRQITFNKNLADDRDHVFLMRSMMGNPLVFYLDGLEVSRMDVGRKVKFLSQDFNVGGHKNPPSVTNNVVSGSFIGTIKDVIIKGSAYEDDFDIFRNMWNKTAFPDYVRVNCEIEFRPAITPICDHGDSSVTFQKNDTLITETSWAKKGNKPSIEVRFTTLEPVGLLLFTGSRNGEYFSLEIYDRKLYMIMNMGSGDTRRQISADDAANNYPHSAHFVFDIDEGKINVYYDGKRLADTNIPIRLGRDSLETMFDGEIYLGGYHDYDLLPWNIWSRSGFVGCVEDLQVNTLSSDLRTLYKRQGRLNIVDGCQLLEDPCKPNPCKNGAKCYPRMGTYYCDCKGSIYGGCRMDDCSATTRIANINNTHYHDFDIGQDVKTHVNDISTRFKTMTDQGTMWMTYSPDHQEYIKVFFEDGKLKVGVFADGRLKEKTLEGQYNDYEWHDLDIQRRGDEMQLMVDGHLTKMQIDYENFYVYLNKIRWGASIPNAGPSPYFFGHLRNFNPHPDICTDGIIPFIDFEEKPFPVHAITVLTPDAYLRVPNNEGEMSKEFKLILMIKTKQEDSLFLYQPGNDERYEYLAGLLKDGNLHVMFNFGYGNKEITLPNHYLSDDRWHIIEIYRHSADRLAVKVDNSEPVERLLSSTVLHQFDHTRTMYIGGIPKSIPLAAGLRDIYTNNNMMGYRGCLATLVKSRKVIDLGDEDLQDESVRVAGSVVRGCRDPPICEPSDCLNGCRCSDDGTFCDNSMSPFHGPSCGEYDGGFKFYLEVENEPGQVTFDYDPPISSTGDKIAFGFITCKGEGLFAKLYGANDNEFIKIFLEEGHVVAEYKLGGSSTGRILVTGPFNDEKLYTVRFDRRGTDATLEVFDNAANRVVGTRVATSVSSLSDTLDGLRLLEIGSELNDGQYENAFRGIIVGFKHNNNRVFEKAKALTRQARFKRPGTYPIQGNPLAQFQCDVGPIYCGPGRPKCENFGVCQNNRCNCTLTAHVGHYCTAEPEGHYYGYNEWKPGVVIQDYRDGVTTTEDYFAIGVMTYEPNGTIFRVENSDRSQYYDLRLVNGKAQLEYRLNGIPEVIVEDRRILNSLDHVYHIIRMNRTNDKITFFVNESQYVHRDPNIAGVPFGSQKRLMSGAMWNSTNQIEDDWNGILGGLYYNGRYMYDNTFSELYRKYGDIETAPHPFRLKFEPNPKCPVCQNGGARIDKDLCDCTYTAHTGICCQHLDLYGFLLKNLGGNGVVMYNNASMVGRRIDDLSVGFRTARGWGPGEIVRIESADGLQYIIVEIVENDILQVRYRLSGKPEAIQQFFGVDVRGQSDHVVRIHRDGERGYIALDDERTNSALMFEGANKFYAKKIYVGGNYNGTHISNGHYGIVWGINFNGVDIVELTRSFDAKANGITTKYDGEGKNIQVIHTPWPLLCDKGSTDLACNKPTVVPGAGGAGAVVPEIGSNVPVAPIPIVGEGHLPISTGAIIGAIMGGLLFTSAIAFAAAGMKPGFLALSKRFAGGIGKGAYVPVVDKSSSFPVPHGNYLSTIGMDEYGAGGGSQAGSRNLSQYDESYTRESQVDAADSGAMNGGGGFNTYNSSSWFAHKETLENQNQAGSAFGGYGGGRHGYAGSVAGSVTGSAYAFGLGSVTNPDQAFVTLSEDIAVDNVVLTADGRYVVTGSNLGPPQVWNTTNGEMVTTMRGDFMGSTGLHLAANEQYLIGETMAEQAAVDMNDIQTGNHIPIRRVAVWDFNTGNPLPIAVDQLCTASCVSKDGYKVVMAMTDKFGGGTTVKVLDLLSNQVLHEITYPDTIGVADSASCVFISPDDRFVAVGFTNSFDNNANFIVFDLFNKAGVVDSPIVALNADPHCTVILNHDEALTGTKNGELVVWSMKTGKAQRQLTSGDTTMLSHGGMPAAHDQEVKEVALSDDGKYLASASADRTVKVWNMDSESLLHSLHGHNDEVWTVDIASDNSIIVSGSQDGTIKLWRLRNGNQITSFNATMDIFHARFSKDKKTVVALGDKHGARKLIMLQIVSQKKWRMRSS